MATMACRPKIETTIALVISEEEARALVALTGYSDADFLKVFYDKLGKNYLAPHEQGLLIFFESVRRLIPPILQRTDDARKLFLTGPSNANQ